MQRARVMGIRQSTRSFTWYITCSDMSTLPSPILNMSTSVKKSSRLGRESNNVFHFKVTTFSISNTIYSENTIFSSLVTVLTLKWREKNKIIFPY